MKIVLTYMLVTNVKDIIAENVHLVAVRNAKMDELNEAGKHCPPMEKKGIIITLNERPKMYRNRVSKGRKVST